MRIKTTRTYSLRVTENELSMIASALLVSRKLYAIGEVKWAMNSAYRDAYADMVKVMPPSIWQWHGPPGTPWCEYFDPPFAPQPGRTTSEERADG